MDHAVIVCVGASLSLSTMGALSRIGPGSSAQLKPVNEESGVSSHTKTLKSSGLLSGASSGVFSSCCWLDWVTVRNYHDMGRAVQFFCKYTRIRPQ